LFDALPRPLLDINPLHDGQFSYEDNVDLSDPKVINEAYNKVSGSDYKSELD